MGFLSWKDLFKSGPTSKKRTSKIESKKSSGIETKSLHKKTSSFSLLKGHSSVGLINSPLNSLNPRYSLYFDSQKRW